MVTLYIIRAHQTNLYKIGITKVGIEQRMKGLQTGCPYPLELVEWYRCPAEVEQEMHRHLDQYRTKGEWFELNDLVEVRTILSQYLSVSDLMNGEVAHMAENIKLSARFQKAQEIASAQDTPWFMKLLLVIWLMCLPTEIALKRRAPNDGEILERRRNRSPDNPFVIDLDQMDYQFSEDEL